MADEFTDALLRAYGEAGIGYTLPDDSWRAEEVPAGVRRGVLAVARVALERAAEVARRESAEFVASLKTASEDNRPHIHLVVGVLNGVVDDIRALIPKEAPSQSPDQKEGTVP